jgi:hypothetical protein
MTGSRREALESRRNALKKEIPDFDIRNLPATYRKAVLGDYLSEKKKPRKTLEEMVCDGEFPNLVYSFVFKTKRPTFKRIEKAIIKNIKQQKSLEGEDTIILD